MAVVTQTSSVVAPTIAQQIFVIGSGVAGGVAGYVLAKEFSQANIREVPTPLVISTTLLSVLFTIGAGVYLARKAKELT